jgi:precorrin-3B methylase
MDGRRRIEYITDIKKWFGDKGLEKNGKREKERARPELNRGPDGLQPYALSAGDSGVISLGKLISLGPRS